MPRAERRTLTVALCLGACLVGCAERIDVAAVPALRQADAATDAAVDAATDAATDAAVDPDPCAVPAELEVNGSTQCAGRFLAQRLSQVLCTCEDFTGSAELSVSSFDSGAAAEVRVDGAFNLGGDGALGGSLSVAGTDGVTLASGTTLILEGPLAVAGDMDATGANLRVLSDAEVGGQLLAESLEVTGTLTMADPARLQVAGSVATGATEAGAVVVPSACACDAVLPAPPANATPGDGSDQVAVCGAVRRGPLESEGDVRVVGAGTLYVDGDVGVGGRVHFEVPEQATLFVIVSGNLRADGGLFLADDDAQDRRVHVVVAGNGTVQLGGETHLAGSLYAPNAELVTSGPVELSGALLARRTAASAPLELHFDPGLGAALQAGCD